MIRSITLDQVASYRSKVTLTTDKKVNILYGLNGVGKSTFSNYFYDLGKGGYQGCSHSTTESKILVYNQKFIQENFYIQDILKGIFSLSKGNSQAQAAVEEINKELATLADEKQKIIEEIHEQKERLEQEKTRAQDSTWKIKTNYAGGDRVLEFCLERKMGKKETLFNYLCTIDLSEEKPIKTIEDLKDEVSKISGDDAIKYPLLNQLHVSSLTDVELGLLEEIIVGSEDSPIANLIEQLKNSDWVSKGLSYLDQIEDKKCPFCQSETITTELVEQINGYFNEAYQNSIDQLAAIRRKYQNIVTELAPLETYKHDEFSQDVTGNLDMYYVKITQDLTKNLELIDKKLSNPSSIIKLIDITDNLEQFNIIVASINVLIQEHNSRIDNSKSELDRIKKEFWSILRYEYDQTISNFNSLKSDIDKIISDKSNILVANKVLEESKNTERIRHQKSTVNIEDAILSINRGLIDIGITDFYIEKYEDDLYKLVRNSSESGVFSSLSEGEKMIISFLYFRELFKGKQSATEGQIKKIAIIDDPVSSLSHIFVYNIGQLIKNDFFNSKDVEQVFLLTHSLYFFYELTDANHTRREENQNLFRISKNENGSSISLMKYEEIQNDYQSYWSVINDESQPPALIANCMRNIIEYFFNFVQKSDLSNILQKKELQGIRFQAFLRYINRESHSLGQNIFDFKEFDYMDFKEGLRLVFEAMGYPEHYSKMSKIGI